MNSVYKPQEIEAISDGTPKNDIKTSNHLKKNDYKMPQNSNGDIKSASLKISMICPECGKQHPVAFHTPGNLL